MNNNYFKNFTFSYVFKKKKVKLMRNLKFVHFLKLYLRKFSNFESVHITLRD